MGRPRKARAVSVPITIGPDGKWHGYIRVGNKANGEPRYAHRQAATEEECAEKIRALEDELATGAAYSPGRKPTVADYLKRWHGEGVTSGRWKYKTQINYDSVIRLYLVPHIGGVRLDELDVHHVRTMMAAVKDAVSAGKANLARSVLRSALSDAMADDTLTRNVARSAKPLRVEEKEIQPLTRDEAERVFAVAATRPSGARRKVALLMGLRQGELLALAWYRPQDPRGGVDVNLDTGEMTIRKKLIRKTWQHGCTDPVECARPHCRTVACQPPWVHGCGNAGSCRAQPWRCPQRVRRAQCSEHTRACPDPCPKGCTDHARTCPQRRDGGLQMEDPKSRAGSRSVVMPQLVWDALRQRRAEQDLERERAGSLWIDTGLVFTTAVGKPIDPHDDWEDWAETLKEAGVPHARLHDARHTCATFLLAAGIDARVVMRILGWSSTTLVKRYQHPTDELLRHAASSLDDMFTGGGGGNEPAPRAGRARVSGGVLTGAQRADGGKVLEFRRKAV